MLFVSATLQEDASTSFPAGNRREPHGEGRQLGRWESLQEDLIRLVASRLLAGDFLDYVRFRAVCKVWRSAAVSPRGRGVVDPCFHPRRWMMFPEGRNRHRRKRYLHRRKESVCFFQDIPHRHG
ncbi:hypothetical protein BRADI_1g12309v3 [Brachypodium distachyon]|uniref:F-box domain-containing protein n=1 Tax=Brachypodium distachyon TaxID=15368 RepID=A0A2K2DJ56_BRADI|nr:hypothetical protein BRADI_1g12309v3 [Brachypodium distachyon]PNT74305.1 hypothetical protein BRADI_1g12309v3 [Brachypodium distachyon]PNT74306.1 hypothetical protein BRADI_1g12309v3 [Brachypodium distachyon]